MRWWAGLVVGGPFTTPKKPWLFLVDTRSSIWEGVRDAGPAQRPEPQSLEWALQVALRIASHKQVRKARCDTASVALMEATSGTGHTGTPQGLGPSATLQPHPRQRLELCLPSIFNIIFQREGRTD